MIINIIREVYNYSEVHAYTAFVDYNHARIRVKVSFLCTHF